jgi:hypothetical protein
MRTSDGTVYSREVMTRTDELVDGTRRTTARVDDWFHGFEVVLEARDGELTRAEGRSHRHPWTTCPGALQSVDALSGAVGRAGAVIARTPRSSTCVHLNDMVWLAARQHPERRYRSVVEPRRAVLWRDGEQVLDWALDDGFVIAGGPFDRLGPAPQGWSRRLSAAAVDAELDEAIRVHRRGLMVGTGFYTLPWETIERGSDVTYAPMAESCHAFSHAQLDETRCIARIPIPRLPSTRRRPGTGTENG